MAVEETTELSLDVTTYDWSSPSCVPQLVHREQMLEVKCRFPAVERILKICLEWAAGEDPRTLANSESVWLIAFGKPEAPDMKMMLGKAVPASLDQNGLRETPVEPAVRLKYHHSQ